MRRAIEEVERYARFDHPLVLLLGESGVGKSTLAEHLHRKSDRAAGPFHKVDVGTVDEALANSTLFGHESGSFTDGRRSRTGAFVTAQGGTLFLDEIDKASLPVQQRLLHAIEKREVTALGADRAVRVDVRIVVATNRPLDDLRKGEALLPDLYARIVGFPVHVPALRERAADIPVLVAHYMAAWWRESGLVEPPAIESDALEAMVRFGWPWNLRQLEQAVEWLLIDAGGSSLITRAHWQRWRVVHGEGDREPQSRRLTPDAVRRAVAEAGSVAGAARRLGISRTSVYRYLEKPDLA